MKKRDIGGVFIWGGRRASGHNLEISFDIVLAFATRLAPMEVLVRLLLNEVTSVGTMSHFSSWVSLSWLP